MPEPSKHVSRRQLLSMIGKVAGGSAMYQAMSSLGYAAESHYSGPVKLGNARPGASVLVLGAGLAHQRLHPLGVGFQLVERSLNQHRVVDRCNDLDACFYSETAGQPQHFCAVGLHGEVPE